MSTSIDNRIVEMQFDNSQFEKGIGKSIKSLEKLKKGLKMDEAAQSLSKLQKIGDSFSLAKIADGIDNLTYRFSWMGRTVSGILDNLTFKAKALIKSMSVDQISSGWSKYADKTGYVQTIMNATGKSIDEVNKYLDKLMWFSDETSYSFVDMTQALGTLTSSGGDINKLIPMLEGMANATAFAGKSAAEFSRTMYNLNQSYSSGYMQYIDWKSVEMAGVGSEQLKQAFIDAGKALGTLTKEGKTKKGTLVSIANFGTTLNEKWADTRVMEKAFGTFSEMTEKAYELIQEGKFDTASDAYAWLATQYNGVGITAAKAAQEAKSFNEAIAATTDAVSSGWMRTFEIIFGNYDEARVMWTDLANWLWDVFASGSEARNELLQSWKDIGGRTTMLEGIYSMFEAFNNLLYAIKDAWREVFPETTADDLMKISNSIKTLGDRIKEAFSYEETETVVDQFTQAITGYNNPLGAFWGDLEQGAKGDEVKKLQQKLFDMGYDIGTAGVDGIFGSKTKEALQKFQKDSKIKPTGIFDQKTFDKLGESINEAFGKFTPAIIGETTESVVTFSSALENVRAIAQGVFSVLHIGWNVLKFIAKAAVEIASVLSPIGNVILSVFGKAASSITEVDKAISEDGFTGALESLKNFLDPIRKKIQGLADNLSNLKIYIEPVKNWFLDIWNAVKLFMGSQVESASERALDFFERIKGLKSYIEPVKNWFLDIWNAVKLFMGAQVENASERALDFFERIKGLKSYIEPVKNWFLDIWNAVKLFMGAQVENASERALDFFERIKGLKSYIEPVKNWFLDIWNAVKLFIGAQVENASERALDFFERIKGLKSYIEPVKNWFLDIWNAVKLFMGAQVENASERALDFFERIKGLKSYIEPVKNWFLDIWNAVKLFMGAQVENASERALDFFERIKGLKSYIEPIKKNMIGLWNAIRLLFGATTDDLNDGAWKETNFFFTKFKNIGKKIRTIFSPIASFFDGLKERFSSFGTAIGLLLGFIDPSTLDEEKLEKAKKIIKPIQTLFSTIHVLYTKYVEPAVNWIKGVALGAISSIGEFFNQVFSVINFEDPIGTLKNIILIVKNFATGTLGKVFEVVAPIFEKVLNWIGGKLRTLWEGASSVLKSVGEWLSDSVSNVINGVIGLFSGIDNLVATLVPIIGGLLLFNKALNIFSDVVGIASTIVNIKAMKAETDLLEAKDTNRWLKFFGSLALIIAVAAGTVYLLGNMNRESLKRGMISLGLIMLFASIAAGLILLAGNRLGMKDLEKTKDLFIGLSSVIVAMAASIFFLGMMPESSLKQGLKALAWISLLIIGFMGIARIINIGTQGGSVFEGLTNLAMSIGILIAIAYIIGKYGDWDTFISGCRYVAVALGLMAGFCFLLTIIGKGSANISLKGIAQLSIGISLLTLVAMYIGKHYDRSIWKGLIFVGSVMVLFTFMIASLISISQGAVKVELKGILMLGIVLTALSAIVFLIGKFMSWGDAAKGLMVVGGIILAIGFLLREAGKYSENMKVGKIIALVFMLGFLAMAFAYAISKIKNVKWQTMIAFAGSMALALGALVAACLVAGKLGAGTMISGSLGIAGALAIIVGSLTLLVAGLGEIDKLTNGGLIEALERGGDVMAAVGAAVGKLIGGVVSGFSSVTSDALDNLATSINNFTASFSTLKTSVSGVAEDTEFEDDATKALDIANTIKEFFDKIGLETEGISTTNVVKFNSRVKTIVEELGEFGVGIGQIRQGIAGISSEGNIDADTEKAINVAKQIKEGFFDKIGGEGMEMSVDGLIKYNASVTSILTYTSTFSSNMSQLRTDIGGMSETDIQADTETALACAKVIAEFFTKINSDEYNIEETKGAINELFTGSSETDSLIGRIKTLGENMAILHSSIGPISETTFESDIEQMMAAYNLIADFINKVSADDFKVEMEGKIYDIKDDIRMLGEGVVDFANATKDVDVAAVSSVANAMSSAMNSVINVAMPEAAYNASSYLGMFVTVGMNIASGLANGLRKNANLAVLASKKVASQMLEAARETLEVNSPSKKFEKIGMYSDRGLANGVSKNSGLIISSIKDASTSALDAARSSLSNLANILMGDMDADPVIRPVVDMSDVNRSVNRINGLVGGSRTMNIDATVRQAQNVASIMNRNQMQKGTNPNGFNGSEPTNPVNVSGNNFYIRSDNDVKMLANELATLTRQQQRSLGAAY